MISLGFKKIHPQAVIPQYQTSGSAGFDLVSVEESILEKGKVSLVPTGLVANIPEGYEIQIRARSGLAAKKGVFLVNGVGTIDSDYRGEIKVILSTCIEAPVVLKAGDRIAQAVLSQVDRAEIIAIENIEKTARGTDGFGSTGVSV